MRRRMQGVAKTSRVGSLFEACRCQGRRLCQVLWHPGWSVRGKGLGGGLGGSRGGAGGQSSMLLMWLQGCHWTSA